MRATEGMNRLPPASLAWLTWGLIAALFFAGFFQRVAPAVMVDELMREFAIAATLLGTLSAAYFYAEASMQVFSGMLADAKGPRWLAAVAAVIGSAGILLFASADSLWLAMVGRGLMGASFAVAFVAAMKLAGHWFPANRFATVTGVSLLIGNIGGILAGVPLAEAVAAIGWRASLVVSAAATLALALAIWLWVRDDPNERGYASHAHPEALNNGGVSLAGSLKRVISQRETWMLFCAAGFLAAPVLTFAGLWGVPYLVQAHGMERSEAASLTAAMFLGYAVGGPALGALSDRIGLRRLPYIGAAAVSACGWVLLLAVPDMPLAARYALFAMIGFSAGGIIIGFAFAREVNHPGAGGTVGGVVNTSVLGVTAILQSALGWILDQNWQGAISGGARIYDAAAYEAAFFWLAASAIAAMISVAFTRETHCRLRYDSAGQKLSRRRREIERLASQLEKEGSLEVGPKAAAPSSRNGTGPKVFGIGFGKTGTKSLQSILQTLGYRMPNQQEQEMRIVKALHAGDFQPLIDVVSQHDAFQDKPFSQGVTYAQVDALFPGSKFILTVRDPDEWFDSLCRYSCKTNGVSSVKELDEAFFKDKTVYLYKNYSYDNFRRYVTVVRNYRPVADWSLSFDREHFIGFYTRRNEDIIRYFDGREQDLLVIDLTQEKDISRILDFLGLPQELNCPMPHKNRTDRAGRSA